MASTAIRSIEDLPGPRGVPGLGNALQVRRDQLHLMAERWCREYGPVFRFDLGPRRIVGVGDVSVINEILRERPERFRRWTEIAAIVKETGADGVFAAEGEDWRRQRRLAVTALNSNHLQRYFGVIRLATERLYGRFTAAAREGAPFAIHDHFKSFTLDVTCALAFGHDLATGTPVADLRPHIDRVFAMTGRRINAPFPYWRRVKLPADRALDRSLAELRLAAEHFIEQGRARIRARPELREQPENFLEAMLVAQEIEGRFSDEELFGNTITMLLAGEDTTAATLAWTTWLIVQHPEVQEHLAHEARELLGDARLAIDHDTAAQFAFGEAVLREAMRLKPVAPVQAAESLSDAMVADVRVPAGTRLLLLTRHAAKDEGSSAPPEDFDPIRWLRPGNGHDPKRFLAFGAGPRFCPGRNLAFIEAKAALAMLARNFRLLPDPAARPVRELLTFTMSPQGLRVRLQARSAPARRSLSDDRSSHRTGTACPGPGASAPSISRAR